MKPKITKEERSLIKEKIKHKIENDTKYQKQIFEQIFNDPVKENIEAWKQSTDKEKDKIVKIIISKLDKAMLNASLQTWKFNQKKALEMLSNLKHEQMVKLGIRKNDEDRRDK